MLPMQDMFVHIWNMLEGSKYLVSYVWLPSNFGMYFLKIWGQFMHLVCCVRKGVQVQLLIGITFSISILALVNWVVHCNRNQSTVITVRWGHGNRIYDFEIDMYFISRLFEWLIIVIMSFQSLTLRDIFYRQRYKLKPGFNDPSLSYFIEYTAGPVTCKMYWLGHLV